MQQVALLRVGIDSGAAGIQGPLYPDGSFESVPIPDTFAGSGETRTYGNTLGSTHPRPLVEYFPVRQRTNKFDKPMHVDPEFKTFTYGDPTVPKRGLRRLQPGDLLVFYAGLNPWDTVAGFSPGADALYLIGYFEVVYVGFASDLEPVRDIEHDFAENFHVRNETVYRQQRDKLLLVKGGAGSRLLRKAVCISEFGLDKVGKPLKILAREMHQHFGGFGGRNSVQRSNPRWIPSEYADTAVRFVKSCP